MREYLGDSVYVELKNDMIRLFLFDGIIGSNEIYLEPEVWSALLQWARSQVLPTGS